MIGDVAIAVPSLGISLALELEPAGTTDLEDSTG
jgi:hypothetical protein